MTPATVILPVPPITLAAVMETVPVCTAAVELLLISAPPLLSSVLPEPAIEMALLLVL